MTVSNRRKNEQQILEQEAVESHPLYMFIMRANSHLLNTNPNEDKFNAMLNALHHIAGNTNEKDHVVNKNSTIAIMINNLFKEAKAKYVNRERLNEIRMKQVTFLEHMNENDNALRMLDSLAKNASAPLRWAAINSRTWLYRKMGRFEEALASAEEVLSAYVSLPKEQKPSRRRYEDALKLAEGIKRLMGVDDTVSSDKNVSVSTSFIAFFSKPKNRDDDFHTEDKPVRSISPLVNSLFQ